MKTFANLGSLAEYTFRKQSIVDFATESLPVILDHIPEHVAGHRDHTQQSGCPG